MFWNKENISLSHIIYTFIAWYIDNGLIKSDLSSIQLLQILGDNIFLTLEWQFPIALYSGFSVGLTPISNIWTSIRCSYKLILDNSSVLLHVVAINNLFTAL